MEYNQIFSQDTLTKLDKRSQDNLKKIMGNKSLMQTMISSQKLLGEIMQIEAPYKEQLEQLAIQMVEDMYPIITEDNIKIDAKITNVGDVNDTLDENINENSPEAKRRVINGITQGAALNGTFSFYMFKEYLDAIDDTLVEKYNQLMKEVFGVYDDDNAIAMFLNAIAQGQKTGGGSSKVIINEIKIRHKNQLGPGDNVEGEVYDFEKQPNKVIKKYTATNPKWKIKQYNFMKSHPDLFPIVYKSNNNYTSMEKLNTNIGIDGLAKFAKNILPEWKLGDDIAIKLYPQDILMGLKQEMELGKFTWFKYILKKSIESKNLQYKNLLLKLYKLLNKLNNIISIQDLDIHSNNIGEDGNGNLKLFDIGLEDENMFMESIFIKDNTYIEQDSIIESEQKKITIKVRALCFPMLVHEIIKGLYELVSLQGFSGTKDQNQQVVDKVDKLENEPHDLKYGKFIYEALNNIFADSDYNDSRIKEFFFSEVYQMGDTEFIEFVENAINESLTSQQQNWVKTTLKEISIDLKADDWDSEGLDEITVNKPFHTTKFPIEINNINDYNNALRHLKQKGYKWRGGKELDSKLHIYAENKKFPFYIGMDNNKELYGTTSFNHHQMFFPKNTNINEITVNKPTFPYFNKWKKDIIEDFEGDDNFDITEFNKITDPYKSIQYLRDNELFFDLDEVIESNINYIKFGKHLNESKSPCWDGYKKLGTKKKNGKTVNNCVPINENEERVECSNCDWGWDLKDGGKKPYLCHKCGHQNKKIE
jgi:hypothetical protein